MAVADEHAFTCVFPAHNIASDSVRHDSRVA